MEPFGYGLLLKSAQVDGKLLIPIICIVFALCSKEQSLTRHTHQHQRVHHLSPSTMMDNLASRHVFSGAQESILTFSGLSKRPPLGGKRWLTNWIHGGHAMMMYRIMTYCGHDFPHVEVLVLTLTLGSLDWTSRTVPITTFCTLFLTTLLRYI